MSHRQLKQIAQSSTTERLRGTLLTHPLATLDGYTSAIGLR